MIKGCVVALVSATVLVAPSVAGASERAAAQAYGDAALRLTQDVKAAMPSVRAQPLGGGARVVGWAACIGCCLRRKRR
jgi:hypothetical protein